MTLQLSQCPLLAKHAKAEAAQLVELFNAVSGLEQLAREVSRDRVRLHELHAQLERVRGQLMRKRYRVGLIGPFQIGKSTMFNNVIGAKVASVGGGSATTAAITRLYPIKEGQASLRIHYLTGAQFLEKLHFLQAVTNLQGERTLSELLSSAANQYEKCMTGELQRIQSDLTNMEYVREIDVKYLGLLIKSYEAIREKVERSIEADEGDVTLGEAGDVASPEKYLNHPLDFSKESYRWEHLRPTIPPVVATADVFYPTEAIPEELVIVDTPGLGSMGRIDEWLLGQYIPRLDGAIVVTDAARPMDETTKKILQKLQERFPQDFGGRVWVVGARADTIDHVWADSANAGFHNYKALSEELRVDLDHVSFFTKLEREMQMRFGQQPPAELCEPALKPLASAWLEMLADGGVARLRRIMQSDLARQIGASLVRDCQRGLSELRRLFQLLVEQAINDAHTDPELENLVRDARLKLRTVTVDLRVGVGWLENATRQLHQTLQGAVAITVTGLQHMPLDQVFEDHALLLERALHNFTREQFVALAYDEVRIRHLDALEQSRKISIPPDLVEGIVCVWEHWKDEDRTGALAYGPHFPSFLRNKPFEHFQADRENPFTLEAYAGLMQAKLWCVSQQVAQVVRQRLFDKLQSIERLLSKYLNRDRAEIDATRAREIRSRMSTFVEAN